MRNPFVQRLMAVLLCAAIGCQGGPGFLARRPDDRSRQQPPASGGDSNAKPVGRNPLEPPTGEEIKPSMATLQPATAAKAPSVPIQQVTYLTPAGQSPASADQGGSATPQGEVALKDDPNKPATPLADFARSLVPGSEPTFYLESMVMRGQTPARDFFLSDRFIMASIMIAAVVIPFAVHDSRQPLPTVNGTKP